MREKSECSYYSGITLLSIAGKILACLLLNRLIPMTREKHAREGPVLLQVQQRNHRYDIRAEAADTAKLYRTEYCPVCSFHRPSQDLKYFQMRLT